MDQESIRYQEVGAAVGIDQGIKIFEKKDGP